MLQFDYQYGTTTGDLTVSLGGVTLGVIPAPSGLDTNFQTFIVQVDDPALLGQTLTLQFLLDGVLGSTVYLDNIVMPGLINGDFQTGNLTVWNTSGVGSVGVSQVASSVALDIHPGSCPNPIKTSSGGVIPMAFLGTRDLDITNIDTTTIRLAGIAPIRTFIEDISTPFEPYVNRESAFDCNRLGPDGFNDLTIKFDTQQVVPAMGPVNNGDLLVLTVTAELFDGTPIRGEDVVVINKK